MEQAGFFRGRKAFLVDGVVVVETGNGLMPRKWTQSEYYRMGELIVMNPMGAGHAATITKVAHLLFRVFGEGFTIRVRLPLAIEPESEPDPDIAVVVGSHDNYIDEHPSTAILVIEVSNTSLVYDRTDKTRAYARASISKY